MKKEYLDNSMLQFQETKNTDLENQNQQLLKENLELKKHIKKSFAEGINSGMTISNNLFHKNSNHH